MITLGIETSCDETAAAVVADGRTVLSSIIASQAELHGRFGGVVPEIASRKHVEAVIPVIDEALAQAGRTLREMDLIAVTRGPGLVGALLVGISAAKGLSAVTGIPMVGVNHIEGHICANYLVHPGLEPPFLCLVASGGHSHLVHVHGYAEFEVIARTRDDAAGEAFDKIARTLGLGYPGGPRIEATAIGGDPTAIRFPRTRFADDSLDFSFSGLKTAALNYIHRIAQSGGAAMQGQVLADFAASFQFAIVDTLAEHAVEAARRAGLATMTLAGGVSANQALRQVVARRAEAAGIAVCWPPAVYCTDNAAMIAAAGTFSSIAGRRDGMELNAYASSGIE